MRCTSALLRLQGWRWAKRTDVQLRVGLVERVEPVVEEQLLGGLVEREVTSSAVSPIAGSSSLVAGHGAAVRPSCVELRTAFLVAVCMRLEDFETSPGSI